MTKRLIRVSYWLAFLSLANAVSSCTDADNSRLQSLLQKGIDRRYPGIAVMIQSAGGGVESGAAGYADLEHHVPMRVDDAFHMASITKTFTAVAVLRLVDAHKLSLGTTLKECLGEAVGKVPNAGRITVSQLLDHSSGIYPTNNDMDYLTTVIGPKLPSSAQTQGSRDDRSNMKPDNLRRFMSKEYQLYGSSTSRSRRTVVFQAFTIDYQTLSA